MIVVDSTVWIDYFRAVPNPHTNWLDRESARQPLAITDLILCEVLQVIRDDVMYRRVQRDLCRFTVFDSGGATLATKAAANYRLLRSKGFTIRSTIDSLIATFCLSTGYSLIHRDRDFDCFERVLGLQVVHP
ncbi:PilT protein-like protein [Candidatus Koribacter versatilis Ellin345]|uniref:Ribonuclease VapC n=1 Tax=Koribacter versatilis (strain Ellin345) TaxID=204669 RepID=Q1IT07_KORVE|nr:PIN domain nuclease [Candidatus Koribacter versatilis]ABF39993.1 PilT protein-like protein [Candidatus Koribacter versatilis Ellin345]